MTSAYGRHLHAGRFDRILSLRLACGRGWDRHRVRCRRQPPMRSGPKYAVEALVRA